ncbi:asparagine synthase, glutamine-hydrolyzing [Saprospira grandis DSM 2844]|uniref:asparagine synthase (glutamine-hydrolyzing) n=1 Tax=Saprospira grandis DSM 2844 TaxID=694433 RepID=J1I3V5_9BACT|nr:asparagine synthase (glutamine-hydrolyzing) [Saprospira grandis]EJF53018.1 asparagine synthase, glutamine-hydrolyzing [Saprospira grandis DSM 2844]
MCRLSGFWDFSSPTYDPQAVLQKMRDSLQHGGPDYGGAFLDAETGLALGHRRLSIIDLSPAGNQPLYYKEKALIFNGEIYNYQEIRKELQLLGRGFQTESDTEVLFQALEEWGEAAVNRFHGMFAFALWDKANKELLICRDRLGVKPLYYYYQDGLFLFASELKAFHQHPRFRKEISPQAVSLYLQQGYIPAPYCIFKGCQKLKGGHFLKLNQKGELQTYPYWSLAERYAAAEIPAASEAELKSALEKELRQSFALRMVADVPVGVFLSGGVDSSIVAALLQDQSAQQLRTFTIGFKDKEYNEANQAKAVAEHIGSQHEELYCGPEDFEQLIPNWAELYDEPFGDSSGIPTYLVAQMAKQSVKVSLSADGGDELFGGYTKYEVCQRFYPKIKKLGPIRPLVAALMGQVNPFWLERNASKLPLLKGYKNISNKWPKLVAALGAKDQEAFFHQSSSYISPQKHQALFGAPTPRYQGELKPQAGRYIGYLGSLDLLTYLEGDIMVKVDRATMAVALEGREPLLDHQLLDFALSLPDELKIRSGQGKYLLRQLLYDFVPKELIERPKQGFSIPIEQWLRGLLRPDLEALAQDKAFADCFGLQQTVLEDILRQFLDRKAYINPHFIWFLYVLRQWYKRWF